MGTGHGVLGTGALRTPDRDKRIMSTAVSPMGDPLRQNRLGMERVCFVALLNDNNVVCLS